MPPIRPSLLTPGLVASGLLAPGLAALAPPAPAPAPAKDWTQLPPLTAPVDALRQASAEVPAQPEAGIQDLLEESRIEIDAEGRRTTVYRYVFRVDQDGAVDDWRQVGASWSPWREARPEIRARVITPDGQVHSLDPKTIGEYSDSSGEQDVYGDSRTLKAPLPQLQKGAIAEVLILRKDDRPFSATGATGWYGLAQPFPVRRTVLSITAPAASSLKAKVFGLPGATLQRSVEGGLVRLSLELGPQPASKRGPANLPADQATSAAVAYTTTPSWQAAAAEYAAIVDRQAADPAIAAWAAEAVQGLKGDQKGGPQDRDARIARILDRLHRQVRYTGIEFGDRAITPAPPSEVLKRGYGDCKDKATLLVAALRASGIPADVALLQTGPGADVDPDIPGLGQFNHAIVHVPGDRPLWIDATADLSPLGTAYLGDEGRYALIASAGTRALARIPQAGSADNWESESREVWFGDEAPGRVKETTDAKGYFASHYRADYLDSDPKKTKETLENYVKDAYKADALGPFTFTPPRDLSTPFRLVLEATAPGTVLEDSEHASATLNVWSMFSDLLSELGGLPDAKDPKPRKDDLLLPLPYTRELHATIHCPEGYRPGALPPARTRSFGPATLVQSFQAAPDGTVTASFRLDTGKRVWSASEVEEARQAIKTLGDEDVFVIRYDQVGEAALQAGQAKEAIEAFQALAKAHPGKASPLLHYANALLAVGLGEEARAQAKLAVQAEPGSMRTHSALAWIEQHDLVGRRFGKGWDRAGAIAEYRKAMALDPKDYPARGNLSILLEYGTDGIRYSRTADLPEAVKVLQGIRTDLDRHDLDINLVIDLAKLGRFDEAVKVARAMPADASRNAWLACALVAQLGQERGLAALAVDLPDPATRRAALSSGADQLLRLRRYPETAALLRLGSEGSSDMAAARQRAELFDRTRRIDTIPATTPGPIAVVEQLMQRTTLGGTLEAVKPLISPATFDRDQAEKAFAKISRSSAKSAAKNDMPLEVVMDLALSLGQFAADGDDAHGYRVTSRGVLGNSSTFYVDRMDGAYRVVADNNSPWDLGLQALWYLDHAQPERAAAWLDQARQVVSAPPADDLAAGSPFARLWTRGVQAPPERQRLAALALAAFSDSFPAETARKLAALRPGLKDPQEAISADVALAFLATVTKQPELGLAASARLIQEAPQSLQAMRIRVRALRLAGQTPEAIAYAQARMAEHPELEDLQAIVSSMQGALGRFEEGEQGLQSLIDRGRASATDYNNLAWSQVVRGAVTAHTLDLIRTATQGQENSYSEHTLSAVLADLGRTTEAKAALLKEMDLQDLEEPGGAEWYVLGRIAEQLGIPDAARACYQRVKPESPREAADRISCPSLAAQRLAALKAAP